MADALVIGPPRAEKIGRLLREWFDAEGEVRHSSARGYALWTIWGLAEAEGLELQNDSWVVGVGEHARWQSHSDRPGAAVSSW